MTTNKWTHTFLGEQVNLLTGFPFKSAEYTEDSDGIPLVRGDNVVQGTFRWEDVRRWSRNKTDHLSEYFLNPGDVVLAMDRPWIEAGLKYACVTNHDVPCLLVQRVSRLRAKSSLDQKFLRYVIGSPEFTNHVLGIQTGTAVPHISSNQICQYKFLLPPLPEQRAIAGVLGALDDKIELNRRMNRTLESLARAVFCQWFVENEGNNYEERSLDEIANYLNGLALQKYPAEEGKDYLPVIKIAQLRKSDTSDADKASTNLPVDYIIHDGDILFSWSGSLEVIIWCGGKGALNQHLFKVTSRDYPKWFYYFWTKHHLPDFQAIAAGKATTMGHIQRHHLHDAKVLVPSKKELNEMDKVMSPIVEMIINNEKESRTLASLRDALLPKLMRGEVRVAVGEPRHCLPHRPGVLPGGQV